MRNAFGNDYFNSQISDILIVLIPKVDHPKRFMQFCLISLCNMEYKMIIKVLVNRLRPFLHDLISPLQSSLIPRRGTSDNVIVA